MVKENLEVSISFNLSAFFFKLKLIDRLIYGTNNMGN